MEPPANTNWQSHHRMSRPTVGAGEQNASAFLDQIMELTMRVQQQHTEINYARYCNRKLAIALRSKQLELRNLHLELHEAAYQNVVMRKSLTRKDSEIANLEQFHKEMKARKKEHSSSETRHKQVGLESQVESKWNLLQNEHDEALEKEDVPSNFNLNNTWNEQAREKKEMKATEKKEMNVFKVAQGKDIANSKFRIPRGTP